MTNIKHLPVLFVALTVSLFISACSGGGSGGSVSGAGTSIVEGNISSVSMAMLQPINKNSHFLADFFKPLLSIKPAFAATTIEGVQVEIGQMRTTTDANGYFMLNGVPPGTHEIRFSKNGQVSTMSVNVRENDIVTMQNISMNGSQAHAGSVTHRPSGMPGTPGTPGTPYK